MEPQGVGKVDQKAAHQGLRLSAFCLSTHSGRTKEHWEEVVSGSAGGLVSVCQQPGKARTKLEETLFSFSLKGTITSTERKAGAVLLDLSNAVNL